MEEKLQHWFIDKKEIVRTSIRENGNQLVRSHLRVDISELRERSSLRIAKELGNGLDIGGRFVFSLGPGVEFGIWREARVEIVDPSDIILRKLLENGALG